MYVFKVYFHWPGFGKVPIDEEICVNFDGKLEGELGEYTVEKFESITRMPVQRALSSGWVKDELAEKYVKPEYIHLNLAEAVSLIFDSNGLYEGVKRPAAAYHTVRNYFITNKDKIGVIYKPLMEKDRRFAESILLHDEKLLRILSEAFAILKRKPVTTEDHVKKAVPLFEGLLTTLYGIFPGPRVILIQIEAISMESLEILYPKDELLQPPKKVPSNILGNVVAIASSYCLRYKYGILTEYP